MLIVLSLLGLSVASAAILIRELRSAPEAYEDETGFHVVRPTATSFEPRRSGDACQEEAAFTVGKHASNAA
jgi:hypothetical protein